MMKDGTRKSAEPTTASKPEATPRTKVLQKLLDLAKVIRRNGSPAEAMVAAEFEEKLQEEINSAA